MKKYPIGFHIGKQETPEETTAFLDYQQTVIPKKSVVRVYFPHRGTGWSYYNDRFDLKVGDFVYVEGKLEGYLGQVKEVNYSFKIKVSDYKKVVAVVDTHVCGTLCLAGSHVVSFDRAAIPFSKVLAWFKAPEDEEEYVCGNDDTERFFLEDLSKMKIAGDVVDRGHEYYMENRVAFIEIDGTRGRAIVAGGENYEIEFDYGGGEISNLKCSCFCSSACKHEFAVMLQLRETLGWIADYYEVDYRDYVAILSKEVLMNKVLNQSGKIHLEA